MELQSERLHARRVKQFEDRLDALLAVDSLAAVYLGSYEGFDVVGDEYRMFISCPSARRLVEALKPLIPLLHWERGVRALLRFGEMHDPDAPEESVLLT